MQNGFVYLKLSEEAANNSAHRITKFSENGLRCIASRRKWDSDAPELDCIFFGGMKTEKISRECLVEINYWDGTDYTDVPWMFEPWEDFYVIDDYYCAVIRNNLGAYCGYVGVKESNPIFPLREARNTVYWSSPDGTQRLLVDEVTDGRLYLNEYINVHGGLTYFGDEFPPMRLVSPKIKENIWVIGFDCAHHNDLAPFSNELLPHPVMGGQYRDKDYVDKEISKTVKQLEKRVC